MIGCGHIDQGLINFGGRVFLDIIESSSTLGPTHDLIW
jgi:hypothetical protein